MTNHIAARFRAHLPKRILTLDGGGTRGIISIAFLAEIERVLQAKLGRGDDFVLADYFDLIGGTRVGSMLAPNWRSTPTSPPARSPPTTVALDTQSMRPPKGAACLCPSH
jgi:hypothetical protein